MAEETQKRKSDHIKTCLEKDVQAKEATTGFEDIRFVHKSLPEVAKNEVDLSTYFLGHEFKAPLIVGAMTGGTPEAEKINATIAEAIENLGLGMGVGSQRAAIQDPKLAPTFSVTRKKAPNAFLIANIGGIQLVHGYGSKEVKKTIEMIQADAVAIHLNALQEAVQPEGQTNFKGVLARIAEIASELDKPVIVKETGCGIGAEEAKKLEEAGVKAIDVGGLGGTSFAAVESYRFNPPENDFKQSLGEAFWDWGIPTAASLVEITQTVKIPIIASGGVRHGIEVAKALALGASLTSVSQPILQAAMKGVSEAENMLSAMIGELRNTMFLVGAKNIEHLAQVPLVITGDTRNWLKARGFDTKFYGKRGAK